MVIDAPYSQLAQKLAESQGEPDWMINQRQQALLAIETTDQHKLTLQPNNIKPLVPAVSDAGALPLGDASSVIACINGQVVACRLCQEAKEEVVFAPLATALNQAPDLVKAYSGYVLNPNENRLAALAYAFSNNSIFIYVPANLELEIPLHIFNRYTPGEHSAVMHTTLVVEANAAVRILETVESTDSVPRTHLHVVEVIAGEGAQVQYGSVQNWGDKSTCYTIRKAIAQRNAQVEWVCGNIGGCFSHQQNQTMLVGEGSQSNMLELFYQHNRQRMELETTIMHQAPNTNSDILLRGVAAGHAHITHTARTNIDPNSTAANAYQRSQTLMLSKNARVNTIPALEIRQNEVQAGHAVTTGQLDENHVFYLMTRGLTRQDATRIMVEGFLTPILLRMPLEEGRKQLQTLIDRKLSEWI